MQITISTTSDDMADLNKGDKDFHYFKKYNS